MCTQGLIFKEMLVNIGVSMPIHIPNVPDIKLHDIKSITNFYKMSGYIDSAPPTYNHLHHTSIIQKESTTNTVSPNKYFVALLKMVTATNIYGRKKCCTSSHICLKRM